MRGLEGSVGQSVPPRRNLGFHRERNPEIGGLPYRRAKEFARRNANKGINRGSDRDCFARSEWFVRKAPIPPGVTDDGDRMPSRHLIVRISEKAALLRHYPQYRKVAARNQSNLHFFQFLPSS